MTEIHGDIRKLAEAGELQAAVQELHKIVVELDTVDTLAQAQGFELLGRCQQGLLANVQAQEAFGEAARLFSLSGDTEMAAYCELMRVRQLLDERLLPMARAELAEAWKKANRMRWHDVLALIAEFQGYACIHAKEHAAAIRLLDEASARPDKRKLDWEYLVMQMTRANCLLALGQHEEGRRELQRIHDDARVSKIPRLGKFVLMNFAYANWLFEDYDGARKLFQQVIDSCQDDLPINRATRWLAIMAQYNLGLVEIQLENYGQAHELLLTAWELTREHGHSQLACASLNSLCLTSLMLGDVGSAVRYAKLCNELAQQHDDIEAHLSPYYLALAYLANGQTELATATWETKPEIESNADRYLQFTWINRILRKLSESTPSVSDTTKEIILDWSASLDSRQSATSH